MRIAAVGFVVAALAGCNQVWGNDPVVRWDAPIGEGPPEAALPTARLELLVATTDANGAATNVAETRAIDPPPTVQIGRIDGPLMPTSYDGGAVAIPHDFPGTPWRLVFTQAGGVPHEVHWAPAVGVEGRAVVPQFGGVDREPLPADASYRLAPAGAPGQYSDIRAYTTGVWAVGTPQAAGSVATQPMNTTAMKVVSGSLLAPDNTKGDVVVFANYTGTLCQKLAGAAVFRIALTGANSTETPAPQYQTTGSGVAITGDTIETRARMADRFGAQPTDFIPHSLYGMGASTVMPAFVTTPFGSPLWGPPMIPFIRCIINSDIFMSDAFAVPVMDDAELPRVAHQQLLLQRGLTGGALVYSGLAGTIATTTTQTTFAFTYPVGIPTNIQLGTTLLATDRVTLAGSSPTVDLTFNLDGPSDYATATLYRVTGATLVKDRVFTFTGTTLTIDRAVLAGQTEYVIELRTFTGAPNAGAGDFTRYLATQYSATRFTSTFLTP